MKYFIVNKTRTPYPLRKMFQPPFHTPKRVPDVQVPPYEGEIFEVKFPALKKNRNVRDNENDYIIYSEDATWEWTDCFDSDHTDPISINKRMCDLFLKHCWSKGITEECFDFLDWPYRNEFSTLDDMFITIYNDDLCAPETVADAFREEILDDIAQLLIRYIEFLRVNSKRPYEIEIWLEWNADEPVIKRALERG